MANKFTESGAFSQVTSGGITGGALSPPSYIDWGKENATYNSLYKIQVGTTSVTSVSFKYNSALANPNADQRAASIWLIPKTNHDHSIVATIERNKTIGVLAFQYSSDYALSLNLQDGNWYKFQLSINATGGPFGDEIDFDVRVFDLGLDGTSTPVSIGSATGTIYDINFLTEKAIAVAVTGTKWGGSELMDNFLFNGTKNTMPQIQIVSPANNSKFWVSPLDSAEIVTTPLNETDADGDFVKIVLHSFQSSSPVCFSVIDMQGRVLQTITAINNDEIIINTENYPFGKYQVLVQRGTSTVFVSFMKH